MSKYSLEHIALDHLSPIQRAQLAHFHPWIREKIKEEQENAERRRLAS